MKAEMKATGTLVLTPETGAEAYALMRWVKEAEKPPVEGRPRAVCIDLSLFPETMPAAASADQWADERCAGLVRRPVVMDHPFTRDKP